MTEYFLNTHNRLYKIEDGSIYILNLNKIWIESSWPIEYINKENGFRPIDKERAFIETI